MIYTFPYGRHARGRPFLPCELLANGRVHSTFAMVDSGADLCFFPLHAALGLGFDPLGSEPEFMRGVAGEATFYRWQVTLEFSFGSLVVEAGFGETITSPVLGQLGFFDNARVMFDRRNRIFTVEPYF